MGRPTRKDHMGGIYHVIARGNNKEFIFNDDKDKGYFISILKGCSTAKGCKVYGYVLMNNHYHILMQTMDKKLQEIMHVVNNKYSKYFNLKYERVGHVFQGRYKASIIQDEIYMFNVLRYIHQNPIEAGLCVRVQDYVWCSDKYYRKHFNGLIDTSLIKAGSRKRSLTPFKVKYIENALDSKYTFAEMGANINVSSSSIQEILERYRNLIIS